MNQQNKNGRKELIEKYLEVISEIKFDHLHVKVAIDNTGNAGKTTLQMNLLNR